MSEPAGYEIWRGMKKRCRQPKNANYRNYGGRGIDYCERWESFANFIADMGPPPPGLSLDRIDNDGNYEPGNCRWADRQTQANNRRTNRRVTVGGQTKTVCQWAREWGISPHAIFARIVRQGRQPDSLHIPTDLPKTHCVNGHALTPDNTYVRPNGWRSCRTCSRQGQVARRKAKAVRHSAFTPFLEFTA